MPQPVSIYFNVKNFSFCSHFVFVHKMLCPSMSIKKNFDCITDAWLNIFEKVDRENGKLTEFMDYACRTWVNEDGKFERKMWNHFQNYKIRTTNSIESWHSKLQKAASKRHLNVYEFILLLKKSAVNI